MSTRPLIEDAARQGFPSIYRNNISALQVNLGYKCNQACHHCHVDAGPKRTEMMGPELIDLIVEFATIRKLKTVDLTGGAPELNPHFRSLVGRLRAAQVEVIDRCNLTILEEPGQEDLAEFLAANQVTIVASLPCHGEELVDLQRGKGVYEKSIRGLIRLNKLGYGHPHSNLKLDLVHNPSGPTLPPAQAQLEEDYKRELKRQHGIVFSQLLTITNMPIARFRHSLIRDGRYDDYMATLVNAFDQRNLANLMCKNLISIDWQGYVYDCDFNQMLAMPLGASPGKVHLGDLLYADYSGMPVNVSEHCFGCTAGQGSSCGGALKV